MSSAWGAEPAHAAASSPTRWKAGRRFSIPPRQSAALWPTIPTRGTAVCTGPTTGFCGTRSST